jgi:Uma2 family endonuclease
MLDLERLAPEKLRPIMRAEYDRMVEAGLFVGERIELLRGFLVEMSPIGTRHSEVVTRLTEILVGGVAGRARVRVQLPFAATDDSEPEPDVAVVPRADYASAHPGESLLLIEVAETSLSKDRNIKADLYAEAGAREYWIVDLVGAAVEVFRVPENGKFTRVDRHGRDAQIVPMAFPDLVIRTDELLPG